MGNLMGELHTKRITQKAIAEEMGVTYQYVSMILSGKKHPADAEQKIRRAIAAIEEKRKWEQNNAEN